MKPNKFYKYQASGNDFILFEDPDAIFWANDCSTTKHLCHRQLGVGADGIIFLESSDIADYKMTIRNSDGKVASMCGNALRCIALHAKKDCSIETDSGLSFTQFHPSYVCVQMPKGCVLQKDIVLSDWHTGHHVHTGIDHLVIFVNDLEIPDFHKIANHYRHLPQFSPGGVNVTFAKQENDYIATRTYEKGVEQETLACGTAGASVFLLSGKSRIQIRFPSNDQATYFFDENQKIWMQGKAHFVFSGSIPSTITRSIYENRNPQRSQR